MDFVTHEPRWKKNSLSTDRRRQYAYICTVGGSADMYRGPANGTKHKHELVVIYGVEVGEAVTLFRSDATTPIEHSDLDSIFDKDLLPKVLEYTRYYYTLNP